MVNSTPLDYSETYKEILQYVKEQGIRVIHKKLQNGVGGQFCSKHCIIYVDKFSRNTLLGCYYLLHEYWHETDYREGKFPKFFSGECMINFNEDNLNYIIKAEMSAIIGAHKKLKWFGIYYQPDEMTEKGLNQTIKFWKRYYWGIKS